MKMSCLIDVENRKINIEGSPSSKRLILDFVLVNSHGQKSNFKNIKFGYQLQKSNDEIIEESWPVQGLVFGYLDPGTITSADQELEIDTNYKLLVWYTEGDYRNTEVTTFNTGLPEKAFESMVWNEQTKDWDMLKPYPIDAKEAVFWDEDILEWVDIDGNTYNEN